MTWTSVEVYGDKAWRHDTVALSIDDDCLIIDVNEDASVTSVTICDKEKVKDIARVLVEFLKQEE